jgi:hypothetical protein
VRHNGKYKKLFRIVAEGCLERLELVEVEVKNGLVLCCAVSCEWGCRTTADRLCWRSVSERV